MPLQALAGVRAPAVLAALFLGGVGVSARPTHLVSQVASLRVEENFRAAANGAVLGQLNPGTSVTVAETQGSWSRVTVEGFIWLPSVEASSASGFDLVVSLAGGENLRGSPSGRIEGRLAEGALLEEVERVPGWVRVRRTGWIWTASLEGRVAGSGGASPTSGSPLGRLSAAIWVRSGPQGGPILAAPDGDTLGRVQPGSEVRVLAREGNWARVQVEGWVWMPHFASDTAQAGGDGSVLTGVQVRDLTSDFERLRGRLVEIQLQFISLERAEPMRTDFYEGEPFLLARSLAEDRTFVYVAVPPERVAEIAVLTPLERILIVGRVRSGAASFTGSPILDLVEFERAR